MIRGFGVAAYTGGRSLVAAIKALAALSGRQLKPERGSGGVVLGRAIAWAAQLRWSKAAAELPFLMDLLVEAIGATEKFNRGLKISTVA